MAQPQSPRVRALVPALLLLLGLSPAPVMAQAGAPPGAEQVLGGARFAVPPGWAGTAQNGVWQGRRDFAGERGRRGAALLQVARPVPRAVAAPDAVFARFAATVPELATTRPTTKGEGVTVNGHPIRYDSRCCGRRNDVSIATDTVAIDDGAETHVLTMISLGLRRDDARAARAEFDAIVRSYRPRPQDRAFALEPPPGAGGLDGVFSHMNSGVRPNVFGGVDFVADMEVLVFDRGGLFARSIPAGGQGLAAHCRATPTDCGTYSLSGGGGAERIVLRRAGSRYGILDTETEPLRRDSAGLRIGDTLHERVPPLPANTRFDGTWRSFSASSGSTAFSSGSVSSERLLELSPDGRFRRSGFSGVSSTNSAGGGTTGVTAARRRPAESGRYEAQGYRLVLRGDDGTEQALSLFRPGGQDGDKLLVIDGDNYLRRDAAPARR